VVWRDPLSPRKACPIWNPQFEPTLEPWLSLSNTPKDVDWRILIYLFTDFAQSAARRNPVFQLSPTDFSTIDADQLSAGRDLNYHTTSKCVVHPTTCRFKCQGDYGFANKLV
jgi:hypothetical protein